MRVDDFVLLIWVHWLADFVFQTNHMAQMKSKSWRWLTFHCLEHFVLLTPWGLKFAAVNAGCHFITDAVTSRVNSRLWPKSDKHWFFLGLGADQAIHLTVLYLTFKYL